jgi:hypothetical protein
VLRQTGLINAAKKPGAAPGVHSRERNRLYIPQE